MNCPVCKQEFQNNKPPIFTIPFYWETGGRVILSFDERSANENAKYQFPEIVEAIALPSPPTLFINKILHKLKKQHPSFEELDNAWWKAYSLWSRGFLCLNHAAIIFWEDDGLINTADPSAFARILAGLYTIRK